MPATRSKYRLPTVSSTFQDRCEYCGEYKPVDWYMSQSHDDAVSCEQCAQVYGLNPLPFRYR